jgi:uncharacterized protein (TIGR02145 family)
MENINDIGIIKIGNEIWQTKNLNVDIFRNGDPIPQVLTDEEWEQRTKDGKPAWCYYNNDPENGDKYGKLYNWWAVNDPRGLAPKGFHIPSNSEWKKLIDFLGGMKVAGNSMKSKSGWKKNGNGSNNSGFSALPGGKRYLFGSFESFDQGYWWSSTESNTYMAWFYLLYFNDGEVIENQAYKDAGMYVRCIKD